MAVNIGSTPSPSGRATFCARCGDRVSSMRQRCDRCGSLGIAPKVRGSVGRSGGSGDGCSRSSAKDPWVSKYLSGLSDNDAAAAAQEEARDAFGAAGPSSYQTSQHTAPSVPSFSRSSSTAFSLGIGMPSSISRDLRSSTPSSSPPKASEPKTSMPRDLSSLNVSSHFAHTPASPVIKDSSGGLSKVVGSLVEPSEKRNKWCCHDCAKVFARDSTIYVPPASAREDADDAERWFCKECWTRRYAIGHCAHPDCGKPVLGSTKETGVFVKAGKAVFHGTCFRCLGCDAGPPAKGSAKAGKDIMLDLDGLPTCEDCFGRPRQPKKPMPQTASASSTRGVAGRRRMDSTIAQLAQRVGAQPPSRPPLAEDGQAKAQKENQVPLAAEEEKRKSVQDSAPAQAEDCAACGLGPFDGPNSANHTEAVMVTVPSRHQLHTECFRCDICKAVIDGTKSFVRLDAGSDDHGIDSGRMPRWAHPHCAPPAKVVVSSRDGQSSLSSCSTSIASGNAGHGRILHPTQQRLPRPSTDAEGGTDAGSPKPRKQPPAAVHSFIERSGPQRSTPQSPRAASPTRPQPVPLQQTSLSRSPWSESKSGSAPSVRQFKPSSGAAPPTKSTLNVHRPGGGALGSDAAKGIFSSSTTGRSHSFNSPASPSSALPPSSPTRKAKYGGMMTCSGCSGSLTMLESTPGPAGSSWHRKCLVCTAPKSTATSPGCMGPRGKWPHLGGGTANGGDGVAVCGKQLDTFAKVTEDGQVRCASCFREGR
ncbi:unnamed protein product [Jaminaea pallidilutea]